MKVAFLLVVALLCVALASAGGGGKNLKESKENRKGKESWEGKKNYKSKEGNYKKDERGKREEKKWQNQENEQRTDKKRSKREETTEEPARQEGEIKNKRDKKDETRTTKTETKGKRKDRRSEEEQQIVDETQQNQPAKKKAKKAEGSIMKEEMSKKSKNKKHEQVKQEKKVKQEEPAVQDEEAVIEPVEDAEVTVEEPEEVVEGECSQEQAEEECSIEEPEVTLSSGAKVKGKKGKTVSGKDTAEFQGVPYAEPPQGEDRLREAVLKEHWAGVLQATSVASDCLQYSHFTYSIVGSEDCLYLNIYTPKLPKPGIVESELLPVVVYIHGGAFMFFSGAIAGPKYLLDKDVVLITLNYRLGPLGFFTLGDDTVPGNLGLRDQVTALKWIQRNIKSFGGDPDRVTISGMSAGGASVHYHLLSPLSKGLFNKAISISGSALNPWAEAESLVEKSEQLVAKLGCSSTSSDEIVACLRSRPAEQIVSTAKDLQVWQYNPISPWAPSPEPKTAANPFLPDSPRNLILDGKATDVPWLVSFTSQEGGYPGAEFVFDSTLREHLDKNWLSLIPHLLEFNYTAPPEKRNEISSKIKQFYLKEKLASNEQSIQPLIDMQSDRLFLAGIAEAVLIHSRLYKSPIFTYMFSHIGDDSVAKHLCHCNKSLDGACHADDVGYILETLSPKLTSAQDLAVSLDMVSLWHSFITTGTPRFRGNDLPRVEGAVDSIPFLDIGQNGVPIQSSSADLGNQEFWTSLDLSDHPRKFIHTLLSKDEL